MFANQKYVLEKVDDINEYKVHCTQFGSFCWYIAGILVLHNIYDVHYFTSNPFMEISLMFHY